MIFISNSLMKFLFFPLLLRGGGIKRWLGAGVLLALIGSVADPIWLSKMGAKRSLSIGLPLMYYLLRRLGRESLVKGLWGITLLGLIEFLLHEWVIDKRKEEGDEEYLS
ncbi:hypothetical protein CULT_180028 [[Clostridium] ultunense Esp]|uniref:hypothetical protein n=1 Tax=Thermicanus aegyptius TaxID=94009 RepID=UPI0002B6F04B|nr:hypothetical protein [Thermicanus aegyptius]CCQ94292.1 hypothetical protein CULT_180028 [[Clostridium] ultunense Esp]